MGRPNQATQAKRQRERAKQEKQQDKAVERAQRKEHKKLSRDNPDGSTYEDPDLAGIVPGPQPPQND